MADIDDIEPPAKKTNGAAPPENVFSDLEALRLTPEEAGRIGSERVFLTCEVRKPRKTEFIRVHTDPAMSLETTTFIDEDRNAYLVMPEFRSVMVAGVKAIQLIVAVNQRGDAFLWPLDLGDGTGRRNGWHDTAREAMLLAKREWIKVVPDMPSGMYRVYRAQGRLPDPVFPDKTFRELLTLAFPPGRVVDSMDHAVVRQQLGYIP